MKTVMAVTAFVGSSQIAPGKPIGILGNAESGQAICVCESSPQTWTLWCLYPGTSVEDHFEFVGGFTDQYGATTLFYRSA